MAAQRGKLHPEDELKIQKNYTFLLEQLDGKDLIDKMYSRGIFDLDIMEEIKNNNTRKRRTEVFIEKLLFSGVNGYKVFLESLEPSYKHVIQKLKSTDISDMRPIENDCTAWYATIPEERKQQRINERELSTLVQSLGNGWELVAIELKLTQAQIEQAKMSGSSPHVNMFSVFNKWKQRQGGDATFLTFLNALNKLKNRCTIDWDVVKRVVIDGES